jgi:arylsulfatase A-like enzyme
MYDASLRYLDDQLRTLFTTLRETGLLDDTIVVITADHGESLGDHGIYFVHAGLYEPTVHVPLLIHAPRSQARPGRVSRVVENLDIPATVFDLTGLARPASFRGDSLMKDEPGDDAAFFEHYGRFATGMRRGTVKTIDSRELKNHRDKVWPSLRVWYEAPSLEMFDLARDPGELHDLGAEQAEALRANVGVLDAWRADRAQRQAVGSKVDPKLTETLRALGYVE